MKKKRPPPDDFSTIQTLWYEKLKESGFDDIEHTASRKLKACHSSYFHARYDPQVFDLKGEYFRRASQFLHEHSFVDIIQKKIWELHTEGQSVRTIAASLNELGIQMNKDQINRLIQGLVEEMKETESMKEVGGDSKKEILTLRAATLEDKNFIYATWLQGQIHGNPYMKLLFESEHKFFEIYKTVIDRILGKSSVFISVACLKEDQDVILGYAVLEHIENKNILHWVYVKEAWRRIGIAKDLIPVKIDEFSHITKLCRAIIPAQIPYNPFSI